MTVNDLTYSATIGVQYIKRTVRRFDRALNHHPLPGTPRRRGLHVWCRVHHRVERVVSMHREQRAGVCGPDLHGEVTARPWG